MVIARSELFVCTQVDSKASDAGPLMLKSNMFMGILSNNYSLNFTEDREIGSCRVLREGRGLETGHKSG